MTDAAIARPIGLGTGAIRLGAGLALLQRRDALVRLSGGRPDDPVVSGLFRFWGFRDLAVGALATAATVRDPAAVAGQLMLQGVADSVDAVIVAGITATGRLPRIRGLGAFGLAAGTAAAEFALARWLREH